MSRIKYEKLKFSESEQDNDSTLSTLKQNISERSSPSTLPDIPDPDEEDCPEDTVAANKIFYQGLRDLVPWTSLPEILKKDNKKILPIEGPGYVLIESIIAALLDGYNISCNKDEIIQFIAKELVNKPDHTRYMRIPISQDEVNFNLLNITTSKKYSRLIADMYIPAISSALDIHIRTIQNISGYFAVVNTLPLNTNPGEKKKVITLIIQNGIYQPVVKLDSDGDNKLVTEPQDINQDMTKKGENNGASGSLEKGKQDTKPEVIVISDTDEEIISVKSMPVVIQPKEEVPEIPNSPPLQDPYTRLAAEADNLINRLKEEPTEEPLVEIKWEDAVRSNFSNRRINFDMKPYQGMVPDVVSQIPHDINGLKYYIVDVPEEEPFCTKYRDGRYFDLHSSSRKGFRGVRRVGKCRGSYMCKNTDCAYFLETKKNNQHQFTTIGKNKFCYI